jgi:hypothetical protein
MPSTLRFQARLPGRPPTPDEAERFNLAYCEQYFVKPLEQAHVADAEAIRLLKAANTPPQEFLTTLKRMMEKKVSQIADNQVMQRYQAVYQHFVKAADSLKGQKPRDTPKP